MRIKMVALAPFDGWAFVICDEKLRLLRPPYRVNDFVEASDDELATAISRYHFRKLDKSFKSIPETVRFLKETYADEIEKTGITLPDTDELKELLQFANLDVLTDYLDKIENEFIPNRSFDAAESLTIELLRIEKVNQDPLLYNRAIDIISKCKDERHSLLELKKLSVELSEKFPNAAKKYTVESIEEKRSATCQSGQLMPIGA